MEKSEQMSTSIKMHQWLFAAILVGGLLRLISVIASDPFPGDGVSRLILAYQWAQHPDWQGLSAVWMPLHWYFLGLLIRLWENPLFWALAVGWLCGVGTIVYFYYGVLKLSGDVVVAGYSALLVAIYWAHAWLSSTNLVETVYLFFLAWAVYELIKAVRTEASRSVWYAGIVVGIILFLRHEAKLIFPVLLMWVYVNGGGQTALRFAFIPVLAIAWQLVEPALQQSSFLTVVREFNALTQRDYFLRGNSALEVSRRWVLMSFSSPSVIALGLGLYGIWLVRQRWKQEIFLWLFVVQTAFYLYLSLSALWQPQIRYLTLCFINVLPYSALAMSGLQQRLRGAVAVVLILMVLVQSVSWWVGRNERRPLGWLPVYRLPASQRTLEEWIQHTNVKHTIYPLPGYPRAWDVSTAILRTRRYDLIDHHKSPDPILASLLRGQKVAWETPSTLLLNPNVPYAQLVYQSLPANARIEHRSRDLVVVRLP
jgi:hypothetical protein